MSSQVEKFTAIKVYPSTKALMISLGGDMTYDAFLNKMLADYQLKYFSKNDSALHADVQSNRAEHTTPSRSCKHDI